MTKQMINLAVIGTGRIGRVHAETIATQVPYANLVAVADVNEASVKEVAEQFNVKTWTTDYKELLNNTEVDAVVICSSTDTHAQIIEEAAAAGKHIFCEKPIDHDLNRIDTALRAVAEAGVKFQVGFNRRFDPNFLNVRETVNNGGVGDVHILKITSRDPAPPPVEYIKVSGGLFLDMTIHDFDMARYLTGSEVKRVHAVGRVLVDPAIETAGDVDTAVITLEFENGAIGVIDNSRQAVYGYDQRVEVFGSKGVISAENETPYRTTLANDNGIHQPLPLNFFMDRYTTSYKNEISEFVSSIVDDITPPVTGLDGRAPVVIGLAAQKSLVEGRPVECSEIEAMVATV